MTEPATDIDVELRDVCVAYEDRTVLQDVSISVPRGSFWGIIGPNGSGKTTLIKAILGLVRPVSGSILTLGRPPAQLREQRARIGYVPQIAPIDFDFPFLVRDLVVMGLYGKLGLFRRASKADMAAVARALDRVDLAGYAERHIGELSGGQRQRALIARALVVEPRLLVLDEPTAALDPSATDGFYEWLNRIQASERITTLLVSHDVGVVSRYVHTIACMNTRLVAHGRPTDVLNMSTLESMYGCGAVLFDHGHIPHMVVDEKQHGNAGS
jgi:zinc transport system ATP-binding protein